jgi:hypothetical protein
MESLKYLPVGKITIVLAMPSELVEVMLSVYLRCGPARHRSSDKCHYGAVLTESYAWESQIKNWMEKG